MTIERLCTSYAIALPQGGGWRPLRVSVTQALLRTRIRTARRCEAVSLIGATISSAAVLGLRDQGSRRNKRLPRPLAQHPDGGAGQRGKLVRGNRKRRR